MAVETVTRTICDRCKSVFEEIGDASSSDERNGKPLLYIEAKGEEPIKFDDLCTKCEERIFSTLLKQIRLDKDEKEQEKKAQPSKAKADKAEKKAKQKNPSADSAGDEAIT